MHENIKIMKQMLKSVLEILAGMHIIEQFS